MSSAKKGPRASSQYLTEQAAVRLERLAERLGVAQGRVLDALLSARSDEQLAAFIEAQEYRADPSRPVPVLLDGPVVASMAGAITQSVSSLWARPFLSWRLRFWARSRSVARTPLQVWLVRSSSGLRRTCLTG